MNLILLLILHNSIAQYKSHNTVLRFKFLPHYFHELSPTC